METRSQSGALAEFLAEVTYAELPAEVVTEAKRAILDTLGACLLGARTEEAAAYRRVIPSGTTDEAAIIAPGAGRASAFTASAVNAGMAHQVEFAPGVARAVVHLNGAVPAALAAAERAHASGQQFLQAVAVGAEALIRFGRMVDDDPNRVPDPPDYPVASLKGWWVPALIGPFGSAAATASVLGLNGGEFHQALGLAANMAPTATVKMVYEGQSGKGMLMGAAAGNGLLAADLAAAGIRGLEDIVGGWLPLIVEQSNPARLNDGLGSLYEFARLTYKEFACVGTLFAPLEAVFNLLDEHGQIDIEQVEGIHVDCYGRTFQFYSPELPSTPEGARSNLAYVVAAALKWRDRVDFLERAYTSECFTDPEVSALARKVTASRLKEYDSLYPEQAAKAAVTVGFRGGETVRAEGAAITTERYRFPSREHLSAKMRNVWSVFDRDHASDVDEVSDLVWNLEEVDDIGRLTGRLTHLLDRWKSAY